MNQQFAVALDRTQAGIRNFDAFVGDQFTVEATFYDADGDTAVSDLAGATASMEILRCGEVEITVSGTVAAGVVTFDFDDVDLADVPGRNEWRVKLTRNGSTNTVVGGSITVTE